MSVWRVQEFNSPRKHACVGCGKTNVPYDSCGCLESSSKGLSLTKCGRGFFRVVLVLPPAATWSRARHAGPGGQSPVRSRSKPWGVPEASDALNAKLLHDRRTAEVSTWFAEQSLLCTNPQVALIYIFLEDFGGHALSGPASLWSLQELRSLHGQYEILRGATFLCRITEADSRRPLGFLTNLSGLQNSISLGLPDLKKHGSS